MQHRAGRPAGEDSFSAREQPCPQKCIFVRNRVNLVDNGEVQVAGQLGLTDAFDLVRLDLWFAAGSEHLRKNGALWVDADHTDVRVLLFQESSDARDRAARSDTDYNVRHLAS